MIQYLWGLRTFVLALFQPRFISLPCPQLGRRPRQNLSFLLSCSIRHYLLQDALKTLISAFVLTRIDCRNSLLAACVLHNSFTNFKSSKQRCKFATSVELLSLIIYLLSFTLLWPPVEQRIEYKLLLLAFKSVNNEGPSYLPDLLKFYISFRQLCSSSDSRLLRIPSFRLKSFGQRKFSCEVSVVYNSFPNSLRYSSSTSVFKFALKMHLFPSQ